MWEAWLLITTVSTAGIFRSNFLRRWLFVFLLSGLFSICCGLIFHISLLIGWPIATSWPLAACQQKSPPSGFSVLSRHYCRAAVYLLQARDSWWSACKSWAYSLCSLRHLTRSLKTTAVCKNPTCHFLINQFLHTFSWWFFMTHINILKMKSRLLTTSTSTYRTPFTFSCSNRHLV